MLDVRTFLSSFAIRDKAIDCSIVGKQQIVLLVFQVKNLEYSSIKLWIRNMHFAIGVIVLNILRYTTPKMRTQQ